MLRSEKGNALIFIIIILAVLIILAPVIVLAANTELKQTKAYEDRTQAYYYARSGIESALEWLVNDNEFNEEFVNKAFISGTMGSLSLLEIQPIDSNEIDVIMEDLESGYGVRVVSRGTFKGITKELTVTVNAASISGNAFYVSPFDKAVFVTNYLNNGSTLFTLAKLTGINGDFGAIVDYADLDVIYFKDKAKKWSVWNPGDILYIYVSDDIDDSELDPDLLNPPASDYVEIIRDEEVVYPNPVFPTFPEEPWDYDDTVTTSIDFAADGRDRFFDTLNGALTVYLGSESANIYVNDIQLSDLVINNTGEGKKLNIFVNNSFDVIGNNTMNEDGDIADLMIYYKGEDEIKLTGNTVIRGSIFTDTSDYTVSGNTGFIGHIILGSGEAFITGNSDMYSRVLYAPSSYVSLTGNGTIKGAIIADSASNSGSGNIVYSNAISTESFPWEIFDNLPSGTGGTSGGDNSLMITSYYWQ